MGEGCKYCNSGLRTGVDLYGTKPDVSDGHMNYFVKSIGMWMDLSIQFCPMCGRKLQQQAEYVSGDEQKWEFVNDVMAEMYYIVDEHRQVVKMTEENMRRIVLEHNALLGLRLEDV